MIDIIGWVGTAVFIVAAIYVAHKNVLGMWLMMLGNALFCVVGAASGLTSLVGASIVSASLDFYGIYMWRKDDTSL